MFSFDLPGDLKIWPLFTATSLSSLCVGFESCSIISDTVLLGALGSVYWRRVGGMCSLLTAIDDMLGHVFSVR